MNIPGVRRHEIATTYQKPLLNCCVKFIVAGKSVFLLSEYPFPNF